MPIDVMKQVLEALKEAAWCVQNDSLPPDLGHDWDQIIAALHQVIDQAEKQEPVAYMDDKGYICNHTTNPERWTPLYTAPTQREWVGLDFDKDFFDLGYWEKEAMLEAERILKRKNHVD